MLTQSAYMSNSCMSLTTAEVSQYARLTLKQYGLHDYEVVFLPHLKYRWGQANPWDKKVELSPDCLINFRVFNYVLLHEIVHCIQFKRMGNTFRGKNGRNDFHGKVFKEVCAEMKIPLHLPKNFY